MSPSQRVRALVIAASLVLGGCALEPVKLTVIDPKPGELTALRAVATDRALEDRILALDAEHVTAADVANVLSKGPAPRIMLVHGGVYPVHLAMTSFGTFLVAMGYPEAKIRDPGSGDWSYSPYSSTSRLAGILAWHYEQDGMCPMVIGHSQGGLYVVKILKELAGVYAKSVPVWNPVSDMVQARDTIVDPMNGRERPVVGVHASYASVLGAGGWALALPNQWDDFSSLRKIPDTVDEFTGYFIALDFFALSFPGNPLDVPYEANGGRTVVRNVTLPAVYNHVMVPVTRDLADDPAVRKWIEDYVPGTTTKEPETSSGNVLWAADVWYSIKKHWVIEAQRLVKAKREAQAGGVRAGG